jgi:hypothetical protein
VRPQWAVPTPHTPRRLATFPPLPARSTGDYMLGRSRRQAQNEVSASNLLKVCGGFCRPRFRPTKRPTPGRTHPVTTPSAHARHSQVAHCATPAARVSSGRRSARRGSAMLKPGRDTKETAPRFCGLESFMQSRTFGGVASKNAGDSEVTRQAVGKPRSPPSAALQVSVSLSIKSSRTVPEAVFRDRHPNTRVPVSIKFRTAKS